MTENTSLEILGRAEFGIGESLVTARLPLEVKVPEAFSGRQVAVQVRVPSIPVQHGGWYDLMFEWEGTPIAATRFAIGQRGSGSEVTE